MSNQIPGKPNPFSIVPDSVAIRQHHPLTFGRAWWLLRHNVTRGLAASWHDYVTSAQILSKCREDLPAAKADDDHPQVHVLTGEEQWLMTVWMLASWLHFTNRPWKIHVHDDGTLSQTAAREILRLFPGITIVSRPEADAIMQGVLAPFPRCGAYRSEHPLGIKCFDIPHMAEGNKFILLDSDVLFFRKPDRLIEWAFDQADTSCWFNRDPQEPSPISSDDCEREVGFSLWSRVNSGLCLLNKDAVDFSRFEEWLGLDAIRNGIAWRTEQTLLALGASAAGQGGLLSDEYEVSLGDHAKRNCAARHYVGAVRNRFYAEGIAKLKSCLLK